MQMSDMVEKLWKCNTEIYYEKPWKGMQNLHFWGLFLNEKRLLWLSAKVKRYTDGDWEYPKHNKCYITWTLNVKMLPKYSNHLIHTTKEFKITWIVYTPIFPIKYLCFSNQSFSKYFLISLNPCKYDLIKWVEKARLSFIFKIS